MDASHPTYTVLRSETPDNGYEIIARDVADTAFVDNKAEAGTTYYYKVKAVDASLNSSPASAQASAAASGANDLVARYEFEENTNDTTCNLYRAATFAEAVFDGGHSGNYALELDGDSQFVQLPTTLANHERITVATWLYWRGGSNEQRLFDFGRGEDECMYLEMRARNGLMCFTIKKGDEEQTLEGVRPLTYRNKWIHLALTMDDGAVCLYLNRGARGLVSRHHPAALRPAPLPELHRAEPGGRHAPCSTASSTISASITTPWTPMKSRVCGTTGRASAARRPTRRTGSNWGRCRPTRGSTCSSRSPRERRTCASACMTCKGIS